MTQKSELADDLLEGATAISLFLWGDESKRRRVYHCADAGQLPIFRIGEILHARKSTLRAFIAEREKDAITKTTKAA